MMFITLVGVYLIVAIIVATIAWKLSALVYRYGRGRWFADELKIVRVVVFIFLCGTPYYFYLFEKISFYVSCSSDDIKRPIHKLDAIDTLFVNAEPTSFRKKIYKKYNIQRVVYRSKGIVWNLEELMVDQINLSYLELNGDEYQDGYDKIKSLDGIEYGIFFESKRDGNYLTMTYFLYNFYHEKRISSVTMRSFRRSDSDILYYLLPYSFKGCESVLLEDENTRLGLDYLFSISFSQSK